MSFALRHPFFRPGSPATAVRPDSDEAAARRRLTVCLAASLLLHAFVFGPLVPGARGGGTSPAGPEAPRAISVAFLHREAPATPASPVSAAPEQQAAETESPPGLLPVPGDSYYPASELTRQPEALGEAALDGPELRNIIARGRIVLRLWISSAGEVTNVQVQENDLPDVFAADAQAAFRPLKFKPGERAGQPVNARIDVAIYYRDVRQP